MESRAPRSGETLVYLWNFRRCNNETLKILNTFLSPDEKAQQMRFRQQASSDRYTFCRAILRWHLGHMMAKEPPSLAIRTSDNGKPHINKPETLLQFNYSHSGDYVALAFNMSHPVGIDIENSAGKRNITGIANNYFSEQEAADLLGAEPLDQHKRFYAYWTLKEAYLKARGEGIFAGLSNFSFELNQHSRQRIALTRAAKEKQPKENWSFASVQPLPDYQMALALADTRPVEMTLQIASDKDLELIR